MKTKLVISATEIVAILLLSCSTSLAQVNSPTLAGCSIPRTPLTDGYRLEAGNERPFRLVPAAKVDQDEHPFEFVDILESSELMIFVLVQHWLTVDWEVDWFRPFVSRPLHRLPVYIYLFPSQLDSPNNVVNARVERNHEVVPPIRAALGPMVSHEDGKEIIYGLMSFPCTAFYPNASVTFIGERKSGASIVKTLSAKELALISGIQPD